MGVARFFRERELQFPRRLQRGVRKGEIVWGPLGLKQAYAIGVFVELPAGFGAHSETAGPWGGRLVAVRIVCVACG